MTWWQAYAQAVYPYAWVYAVAAAFAALVFLPLARERRHFVYVVLILLLRQIFVTLATLFAPPATAAPGALAAPAAAPGWVTFGHFAFFMAMAHYGFVAIRSYFDLFITRQRRHSTLLRWIVYGVVMVVAGTIYLEFAEGNISFGIGIASVAAVIGFALQETLANLFAGLTLEADPPFRVGDWIQGAGFTGEVIDITWRATRLRTYEQDTLIIPNRELANAMIVNWSTPVRHHGVHLTVGTSYSDAPGQVKDAIQAVLRDSDGVLADPPPEVYTDGYGDFAIAYNILFFITDYRDQLRIKDRIMSRIWYRFRRDNIKIPFPIRDVNLQMHSSRERQAEAARELDHKLDLLRKLPLFSNLPGDDLQYLASEAHFHRYWPGETIIHQGDTPDFLSILVEGVARVLVRTENLDARDRNLVVHSHSDAGDRVEVRQPQAPTDSASAAAAPAVDVEVENGFAEVSRLKPGDFFGEISVLLGKPASATVRSDGEVLLLVVDRAAFVKVLERHPTFQESICNVISQRVSYLHHITKLATDKKDEIAEEPRTLIHHLRKFLRLRGDWIGR